MLDVLTASVLVAVITVPRESFYPFTTEGFK